MPVAVVAFVIVAVWAVCVFVIPVFVPAHVAVVAFAAQILQPVPAVASAFSIIIGGIKAAVILFRRRHGASLRPKGDPNENACIEPPTGFCQMPVPTRRYR